MLCTQRILVIKKKLVYKFKINSLICLIKFANVSAINWNEGIEICFFRFHSLQNNVQFSFILSDRFSTITYELLTEFYILETQVINS